MAATRKRTEIAGTAPEARPDAAELEWGLDDEENVPTPVPPARRTSPGSEKARFVVDPQPRTRETTGLELAEIDDQRQAADSINDELEVSIPTAWSPGRSAPALPRTPLPGPASTPTPAVGDEIGEELDLARASEAPSVPAIHAPVDFGSVPPPGLGIPPVPSFDARPPSVRGAGEEFGFDAKSKPPAQMGAEESAGVPMAGSSSTSARSLANSPAAAPAAVAEQPLPEIDRELVRIGRGDTAAAFELDQRAHPAHLDLGADLEVDPHALVDASRSRRSAAHPGEPEPAEPVAPRALGTPTATTTSAAGSSAPRPGAVPFVQPPPVPVIHHTPVPDVPELDLSAVNRSSQPPGGTRPTASARPPNGGPSPQQPSRAPGAAPRPSFRSPAAVTPTVSNPPRGQSAAPPSNAAARVSNRPQSATSIAPGAARAKASGVLAVGMWQDTQGSEGSGGPREYTFEPSGDTDVPLEIEGPSRPSAAAPQRSLGPPPPPTSFDMDFDEFADDAVAASLEVAATSRCAANAGADGKPLPRGRTPNITTIVVPPDQVQRVAAYPPPPPNSLVGPLYTLRVFVRRLALEREVRATRAALAHAERDRDTALANVFMTHREQLRSVEQLSSELDAVRGTAMEARGQGDDLAHLSTEYQQRQRELSTRATDAERVIAAHRQVEAARGEVYRQRQADFNRAAGKFRRLQIEHRNAVTAEATGASMRPGGQSGPEAAKVEAQLTALYPQAKRLQSVMEEARRELTAAEDATREAEGRFKVIEAERKAVDLWYARQTSKVGANLANAEVAYLTARADVVRAALSVGAAKLDGRTLDLIREHDHRVYDHAFAHRRSLLARDSFDAFQYRQGLLTGGVLTVAAVLSGLAWVLFG
ncbi:MAG: hypothetical protein JW751_10775 [Polyangiaceae bacterium]|nr:hypothetical protein [Polyangiaceae bacterium]